MTNQTIEVGKLIDQPELDALLEFIDNQQVINCKATIHNIVMKWLDAQPQVMERFRVHGIIKSYGAYLLEYALTRQQT